MIKQSLSILKHVKIGFWKGHQDCLLLCVEISRLLTAYEEKYLCIAFDYSENYLELVPTMNL